MKFNEGKACDAVMRRLEQREGQPRRDLWSPERSGHPDPIELAFRIGDHLFALEHTGIEPFEGQKRMEAEAAWRFKPIQDAANERLSSSQPLDLHIPFTGLMSLKGGELTRVQDELVAWVVATAPSLPVPLNHLVDRVSAEIPGVPFPVSLAPAPHGIGRPGLRVIHLVQDSGVEQSRLDRMRRAFAKKCPKLSKWQEAGATTVLVLEENDISLTNAFAVSRAVAALTNPLISTAAGMVAIRAGSVGSRRGRGMVLEHGRGVAAGGDQGVYWRAVWA